MRGESIELFTCKQRKESRCLMLVCWITRVRKKDLWEPRKEEWILRSKALSCLGILFTGNCIPVIPIRGLDVWKKWLVLAIMGKWRSRAGLKIEAAAVRRMELISLINQHVPFSFLYACSRLHARAFKVLTL